MKYIKTFENDISISYQSHIQIILIPIIVTWFDFKIDNTKFIVDDKFKLYLGDNLVTESGFNIEQPDKWLNEKYVTLHDLKTIEKFQRKGFAKKLLNHIFDYVKNELNLNIITLIVYKDNNKAVNLYFKCGFEIFEEYEDSYSLIKKL